MRTDYFVLKARHSGFYHTDICVPFTASDAYMRDTIESTDLDFSELIGSSVAQPAE